MALALATVMEYFSDELSVVKKGEQHLNSNDIMHFTQSGTTFNAKVLASMRIVQYEVEVHVIYI